MTILDAHLERLKNKEPIYGGKKRENAIVVGYNAKHYGKEYFKQQNLSFDSSSEKIIRWMNENNISFEPLFNDEILQRNSSDPFTDEINIAMSKKLFNLAVENGFEFEYINVHISPDGVWLQYQLAMIRR